MDRTSLENSIRRECDEAIAAIREEEEEEIRRIDIRRLAAVDSLRKIAADETDRQIRREIARLENKDALKRRKLRLQSLEAFVDRMVSDVMTSVRKHPRYRQYLLDAACLALAEIPGRAEVRLAPDDLPLEKEIRSSVKSDHLTVAGDPSIRWGGCLVVDEDGGRIFNGTLERMYFRKSAAIRRMTAKILADAAHDLKP